MKIKFLTLATVVAFLITSCGGVDKQLVDNINSFETDWSKFTTSVNTTGDNLKMESDTMMKNCDETCGVECKDKKMMASCDSVKDACKMNKTDLTTLLNNFNDFKTNTVGKTTTEFAAWKDKAMKGEIKGEDATKGLDGYKTKLSEEKDQLTAFSANLETIKTSCMNSCNAVKEKCAMMDKKDKKAGK